MHVHMLAVAVWLAIAVAAFLVGLVAVAGTKRRLADGVRESQAPRDQFAVRSGAGVPIS